MRRTMLAVATAAGLAFGAVPSATAAGGVCQIQANFTDTSPHGYTAAVFCSTGTQLRICQATAAVHDVDTGVDSGPTSTVPQPACGWSYSTTMAIDNALLGGLHQVHGTYLFYVDGDPITPVAGGDTAVFDCTGRTSVTARLLRRTPPSTP